MTHDHPVLVGVDGSPASRSAVRFAVHDADRLATGLHLVHVLPSYVPMSPMAPLVRLDLHETGKTILAEAARVAREEDVAVSVSAELLRGPRIPMLLKAAASARCLVLGHVRGPSLDRVITGATVTAVAAHSTCPVVAVPPGWSAKDVHDRVLVGVKSTEHSQHLLRRAFEVAAERHAELLLVHAWEVGQAYDDLILERTDTEAWAARSREALEHDLAPLRKDFPSVRAEIRIVHGQAARVLCDASEDADLLLVARRPHAFPGGHVGSTARALLRRSACPVSVETAADKPMADLDLDDSAAPE